MASGNNTCISTDQEDSTNLISKSGPGKDGKMPGVAGKGDAEAGSATQSSSSPYHSLSAQRIMEGEITTASPSLASLSENLGGGTSQQSASAALIANKQKLLQKENLRRVMNPPKLERKHSSGDLHSRLKTRKILGVGETDNGDIHRSKISQVLGHNEHLYVKFPKGVWNWQAFLSAILFVQAVLILLFPRQASQLKLLGIQNPQDKEGLMMAAKYYAVSLFVLSFTTWRFMSVRDKNVVRTVQMASLIYSAALCGIDVFSVITSEISHLYDLTLLSVNGLRLGIVLVCSLYLNRIGNATSGLRKSPSHKDLGGESLRNKER